MLLLVFDERCHSKTLCFYLLVGEMIPILKDMSCLLHMHTRGQQLNHTSIPRFEAICWAISWELIPR